MIRRQETRIKIRRRVLILSEGAKTEPNYFNGIKYSLRYRNQLAATDIEVYQPISYSPMGLVKEAVMRKNIARKQKNPFDSVWIVFDRDTHFNMPETFAIAEKEGIRIGFSNICFELWVLLHYEKTERPFMRCGSLIQHLQDVHQVRYHKNQRHYDHLEPKTETAIRHAEWLFRLQTEEKHKGYPIYEINPITTVHWLVAELLSYADQ